MGKKQAASGLDLNEDKIDLKWGLFWSRILLALGLLIVGTVAGEMIASDSQTQHYIAVGLVFVMLGALVFSFKRGDLGGDEFERRIEVMALAQAGLWVVAYSMLMAVMEHLSSSGRGPNWVYLGPALMLAYQTIMSQYMRWAFANGKSDKFEKFL